jgi:hypothetical protein
MNEFTEMLVAATAAIDGLYMQLPVDGGEAQFRERVYCYELYHQLRLRWPIHSDFAINGEVDKRGHPFAALRATMAIPDFLVHTPGSMAGNYAIVEVKPATAQVSGIREDLRKLMRFRQDDIHYERAIYLFYGGANLQRVHGVVAEPEFSHLPEIELWTHLEAGSSAGLVAILHR